jgi:hypothetical protein
MSQLIFLIIRVHFESLRNKGHVELNRFFIALVDLFGATELGILSLFTLYKSLVAEEEQVLDMIFRSKLTVKIKALDKERDRLYRGFANAVKSALDHFAEAKRAAAAELEIILKHYGDITRLPMHEQTAAVFDLLRELALPENLALVTLLELNPWIAPLEQVNAELEDLMTERFVEFSKRPELRMKAARAAVDKQLRLIIEKVEAMERTGSPFYNPAFVKEVNALMTYYKDLIAQEAGRRHPVKDISTANHLVVEPVETQPYSGKAVTPIPRAHYREPDKPTVELVFAKDFSVTYKNNVEVGMADLILHGMGEYKGKKTVTFNIAR